MSARPGARCVWPQAAQLGEGPCWVDDTLWFVDITAQRVCSFKPHSDERRSWSAPARCSFVLPTSSGAFIVGLPDGVHLFDPQTGSFERRVMVEADLTQNRLNDACIDARGRLWFGTLHEPNREPAGAVYCWDGAGAPRLVDRGFIVSNGPAFSPDGATFYHTDTFGLTVYRYDVDAAGGLSGKRPLIRIEDGAGWPDGTTVDSAGALWVGLFGGACVRRYSAEGELLAELCMPCSNVTKVAFGGSDLKTVFVTSARVGLSPAECAAQPLAGSLFVFEVEVPGLPQDTFTLRG